LSHKSKPEFESPIQKARDSLHRHGTIKPENHITPDDLKKLVVTDEMRKLKTIQREKLLEDVSSILNSKIREFEKHEQQEKWKEAMLQKLNSELNDKIAKLEDANKALAQEKARSDNLNKQLQETLVKLQSSEAQLRLERDWLAQQVETKSKEVIKTITEILKGADKPHPK
jgi:septal ring factor EnvC (AmiA/AmiB activator)